MIKLKINSKIIAGIITISVVAILFYTGPAAAIKLGLEIPHTQVVLGSLINIMPSVEIESFELAQIDYIILKLNGPDDNDIECRFFPNGTAISGCDNINIELIMTNDSSNFGYGYGYRYTDSFGYGYGYGYMAGFLKYNITIDSDGLPIGNYSSELLVFIGDKTFDFSGDTITIVKKLPPQPMRRCSIRAFDGNFNVDDRDFSNNKLKFYISAREAISGTGSISGQKDRDRFSYRFKIVKVLENNNTDLVLNISGIYRIGRDGALKNIQESAILDYNKSNRKISIYGNKINIKSMIINFIEGCDSI